MPQAYRLLSNDLCNNACRNERMGMYRAMTVLSIIGVLAALYFLYQYGMY